MNNKQDEFWNKLEALDQRIIENDRSIHLENLKHPEYPPFPCGEYEKRFSKKDACKSTNKIFCYHKSKGFFWFRIFGIGLTIKDTKLHKPLFSERNGFTRTLMVGDLSITYLKRLKWKTTQ